VDSNCYRCNSLRRERPEILNPGIAGTHCATLDDIIKHYPVDVDALARHSENARLNRLEWLQTLDKQLPFAHHQPGAIVPGTIGLVVARIIILFRWILKSFRTRVTFVAPPESTVKSFHHLALFAAEAKQK
jgi:hypothetical protein